MEEKDKEKQENEKNKSDIDDNAAIVEKALKSFCCYLYVGKGHAYYKAKPWNDDESYPINQRLQCLEVLAANKKTELVPIDKIKLAMDSELIQRPETLMFALAMCARQKKSEKLRAAAYYFLAEHCKEWKYFILFIKYFSILCKSEGSTEENGTSKHNGCGHGWKNAVNKWYLTKSPTSLLELVTHHKGDHGWKHKDILKLSHPDTMGLEVEKRAIMCYIIRGLEAAQKEYGNDPEAKKMLEYIGAVEIFKKCEDPKTVAEFLRNGKFTIDQVHPKALKSGEVWLALLEDMDVRAILKNLPTLTNFGLLTKLGPATELVVRSLTHDSSLRWNKVLPGDVLSILNLYERGPTLALPYRGELEEVLRGLDLIIPQELRKPKTKPKIGWSKKRNPTVASVGKENDNQANANSKNGEQTTKPSGPRPVKQPDMRIRDALRTSLFVAETVDITESSKRTYLVSVRLPGRRHNSICADAGLAIALPLLHREDLPEEAVTIIGFEPRWMHGSPAKITKDMHFDKALRLLIDMKRKREELLPMPAGPLGWAYEEKRKYDVFINVSNEPPSKQLLELMMAYRHYVGSSKPRLINVILNRAPFELKGDEWHDVLTISGFDPHVPWIIEAYVRGLF